MADHQWRVHSVDLPPEASVAGLYASTDLADAYAVRLPDDALSDPEALARFMFGQPAPWVTGLMRMRDMLMAGFGVKTAQKMRSHSEEKSSKRISIFKVYARTDKEILMGEDDRHLDFRVSVLRRIQPIASGQAPYLVVSTVVHCHNRLGRVYLRLIGPFHRLIVQATLRRAAKAGWPTTSAQTTLSL